jgi:hypothetical protein
LGKTFISYSKGTLEHNSGWWIKYFHNPSIQENIEKCNKEQFQATFLNELFVVVLGYTLNPRPGYDLSNVLNLKNARKADGAIIKEYI